MGQTKTAVKMNKFRLLVFIDDDAATNYYNEIIVSESETTEEFIFFDKAMDALTYFENIEEDSQIPEAIFLDINMPKMDGWKFLEHFAEINLNNAPSIVMLTTSLSSIERERAENNPMIYKLLNKSLQEEHLNDLRKELLT